MSAGKIFLLNESTDSMIEMDEAGYISEAKLQEFLAKHPDLLPGDQISPENPRRWLLVSREMGVPGAEGETGRWSLDHLFLDQDAIPTFVECKRSTDTRARREVVAQMLDYAANGIAYWNVDRIRQEATETADEAQVSLDERVMELLEVEESNAVDIFWSKVASNLEQKRVRLVFVSDHTSTELRRLVEFLNEEMHSVEVLAVEVKQYRENGDSDERALVPRVVGLTEAARIQKSSRAKSRGTTSQSEFLGKCTPEASEFFAHVLSHSRDEGFTLYWGEVGFSVRGRLRNDGGLVSFLYGFPPNTFQFFFQNEGALSRESEDPFRQELLDFGLFRKSGDYTLTAEISPDNQRDLITAYENLVKRVADFESEIAHGLFPPDE